MRKVQKIKEEIHEVIDKLSSLAKELHVSEYIDAGEDDSAINIVMGRKLATALFEYVSGRQSLSEDEAIEAAECLSQSIMPNSVTERKDPDTDDFGRMKWENEAK